MDSDIVDGSSIRGRDALAAFHVEKDQIFRQVAGDQGAPVRHEGNYLECGILACGFCRARCPACGHDFLVAFSCKGRAVCPSCNARRMAETAAHLVDHVFPPLPVMQWVLSVRKRLRYFLEREPKAVTAVLHIFPGVTETSLRSDRFRGDSGRSLEWGQWLLMADRRRNDNPRQTRVFEPVGER